MVHEDWPSITYGAPATYSQLTEEEKDTIAEMGSDHCIIHKPQQTDRFIRCTLMQKVNDHCDNLYYSIWVSLSEKSFNDYMHNFNNENYLAGYFGYLSNNLLGYENTMNIYTNVFTQAGNNRPEVVPHDDFDHPFVKDYFEGISLSEAQRRIDMLLTK